jgi:hypothetical protein
MLMRSQQEESMRYWNCYRCGRQIPFDGKIKVIDGQVYHPNCPAKRPTDLPEAGASAERISSVVRSGADIEDTMLKVIQERDYLIEQLYKIYQHKDWLNMPYIVKEAVIFGLEKVSIKDGEEE